MEPVVFKLVLVVMMSLFCVHATPPVFRQFRKDTKKENVLDDPDKDPDVTGVSLLSCAISCAGIGGCESLFYGGEHRSCMHRGVLHGATLTNVTGFEYYFATGIESSAGHNYSDIPQPPAEPPEPLPPPTWSPPPTPSSSGDNTCPKPDAEYVVDLGICLYTVQNNTFSQSQAKDSCTAVGGSLVEIQTVMKHLEMLFALLEPFSNLKSEVGFWTGAHYHNTGGSDVYAWSDGTTVHEGMWTFGEPYGTNQSCVAIMKGEGYQLTTEACSTKLNMLCEFDVSDESDPK